MNTVCNIVPLKGPLSTLAKTLCSIGKKVTIGAAVMLPFNSSDSTVYAENKPEKEKIVTQFAQEGWEIFRSSPDTNYLRNNIIGAFIVGDNTDIQDLDKIRNEILTIGKTNPEIPLDVLQTAIYSAGINAETINKKISNETSSPEEINKLIQRKKQALNLVIEYLNIYPSDYALKDRIVRKLVNPNDITGQKEKEKAKNFQETVKFAVAQLISPDDLSELINTFLDVKDKDIETAIKFLDIFIYLDHNQTVTLPQTFLDSLKEVNSIGLSNKQKTYAGKSILILSQAKDKSAYPLAKKWFETKPTNERIHEADYYALKALLLTAKENSEALSTIKLTAAKFPNLFFDAYFLACKTNIDSPKRQVGKEIINIFNENPNFAHELFLSLFNQNTSQAYSKIIIVMSSLNAQEKYIELLRTVIKNNKENEENRINAMHGLAKVKDKASIEGLLQIALDQSNPQRLRFNALETVLLIDSPDRLTKEFEEQLFCKSPFNLDLSLFHKQDRNKYLFKISPGYTEESTIYSFVTSLDIQYGGSKGYLKELSSNPLFKQKYLIPILNYLKECKSTKRIIDLKLAHLMIYTLGKSSINEASELLADIATYPELYIRKAPPNQITNSGYTTTNTVFIKLVALACLGDVIDLQKKDDSGAKVLHTISRFDSSYIFYTNSNASLLMLAERYEKNPNLQELKEYHKQESIKNLNQHIKNIDNVRREKISYDWYVENDRTFALSLILAKLNGETDLLKIVLDISKEKTTSNVILAIMQALHENGFTANDIDKLGFKTDDANKLKSIYKDIVEERFWLTNIKDSGLTGKGVQVAVIDGGYKTSPREFYPLLDSSVTVPTEIIGLHNTSDLLSRHAHSILNGIKFIAPDVEIISLTWSDSLPIKPTYLPSFLTNDDSVVAMQHLIEGIVEGKYDPKIVNCSFGIKSWLINTKEDGETGNLSNPDLRSALLELLANSGTMPIISTGNDYGKYPGNHRNGEIAGWNALGLRFIGDGRFKQPKNIIHVSTLDEYNSKIAPFNDIQDPLRNNTDIVSLGVHGTLVLPSYYQHRGTLRNESGSGSSYANYKLTGLLSLFLEKANASGTSLTAQELRDRVFNTAKDIPESNPFEVRKKLNVEELFQRE